MLSSQVNAITSAFVAAPSHLRHPAIDEQLDAIDEAGGVRGQEGDSLADFLRLAQAAQRYLAGQVVEQALAAA